MHSTVELQTGKNHRMNSEDEEKEDTLRLSKLGFGFKLIRFTSILSVTWIITALAGCSLGVFLAIIPMDQDHNLITGTGGGILYWILGGLFLFCTYSFLTWGRMFFESRAKNVSGIEDIAKAYSYVSAILNLILNLAGLLVLTVYEEQFLKTAIESIFRTNPSGPILVLLIFLIGIFYNSKLIHGLRMHQDGHLRGFIIFRYFMLGVTLILTIVTTAVISINLSNHLEWTTLCGFLALAFGCLLFMLDVGPTIILHSLWSQESDADTIYTTHN